MAAATVSVAPTFENIHLKLYHQVIIFVIFGWLQIRKMTKRGIRERLRKDEINYLFKFIICYQIDGYQH